jgi:hypothetical protein
MPVLPHGRLVSLSSDLFMVTGSLPNMALPRNMFIWRHPGGALWLHSVIAIDDATLDAVRAMGEPRWMVVPSGLHRLDAPWYKERFPNLKVIAPAAARGQVAQKVAVDATCEEVVQETGVGAIVPGGLRPSELVYRVPLADGGVALVFNDAVFHLVEPVSGFGGLMLRILGSWGYFGMTRIGRWALLRDRAAFAAFLRQCADEPDLRFVCMSHGVAVGEGAADKLREAADRL